jgi:hypothetical protein
MEAASHSETTVTQRIVIFIIVSCPQIKLDVAGLAGIVCIKWDGYSDNSPKEIAGVRV